MTLSDYPCRANSLIILIQRGNDYIIPAGNTVLRAGDRLLINHTHDAPRRASANG